MTQRTFVDACCGFEFSLDQNECETALLTVNDRGTLALFYLAKQLMCAMTQRAFVDVYSGFEFSLGQNERETALLTVNDRGTRSLFHFAVPPREAVAFSIFRFAR
jgi:hypothetical protein